MIDTNPYRPLVVEPSKIATEVRDAGPASLVFNVSWPFIFAANLIAPVAFASSMTQQAGRIGMLIAVVMFLLAGWSLGLRFPKLRSRLMTGGSIVAISQVFPIHHIIAGSLAFELTVTAGGATGPTDDEVFGRITTEFGGFLCTLLTGTALISLTAAIGWMVVAVVTWIRPAN